MTNVWKNLRLALVKAIIPVGYDIVRDYTKKITYIDLDTRDYQRWPTVNIEGVQ